MTLPNSKESMKKESLTFLFIYLFSFFMFSKIWRGVVAGLSGVVFVGAWMREPAAGGRR
jgi:hypothetical protein